MYSGKIERMRGMKLSWYRPSLESSFGATPSGTPGSNAQP
jgi:hypothetical protein